MLFRSCATEFVDELRVAYEFVDAATGFDFIPAKES